MRFMEILVVRIAHEMIMIIISIAIIILTISIEIMMISDNHDLAQFVIIIAKKK